MERSCPGVDLLSEFALGRIAGARGESLGQHVETCAECLERLDSLGATDDLVARLRRLPGAPPSPSDAGDVWARAVLAGASDRPGSQIAADAGGDLARRLREGPVRLDRFDLRLELGVGSFGYVFQAWDPRLERVVALKVQRAGSLATHEEVERFLREARSAAQLKHPAIVSLYETARTEDNVWFLVCEYIDGPTLEGRLKAGAFDPREAAALAVELADALQYAHEHGVVHRDVKPSNIILDRAGKAHLMDFGLAKRDAGDVTMTSDGRVMGTPAYMSPEQAAGTSRDVDARSDIYSLGVVLYEMLTGERPFHGSRRLLLLQVLEDDPRPPHHLRAVVPRDLEVICVKAMSKSPARRYPSARDMADDLRRYLQGQPILARPMGPIERTLRWCRRYPLAVGVLAAVLLGSSAGLWYLSSLSEYFVRETALESARLETMMLDEVWRFYSERVADLDPDVTNVTITQNYRTVHPALPFPATFAIDLAERISGSTGMEVRVYSRYPWPGRNHGGPHDAMDLAALEFLESRARLADASPAEYARFVDHQGQRKLLYYSAQLMEQSCLGCHNHPDSMSPKKDWQVGDVVGVKKLVRPLDREIEMTRSGLRGAFTLMLTIATLLVATAVAAVLVASRRRTAATR